MLKKSILVAAAGGMIALSSLSAFAVDQAQSIALKDGSTVHIFKDGKMGMEDKLGRAALMEQGHSMETNDGKKIVMNGNEFWRVDRLLHSHHTIKP